MGTPPRSLGLPEGGRLGGCKPFWVSPPSVSHRKTLGDGVSHSKTSAAEPALSDPNASTASANASVVVPYVTLATAALVVARVADKFCRCGVQLERSIPPALPAAAMLLTSSLPLPPLLPPSPALSHGFICCAQFFSGACR